MAAATPAVAAAAAAAIAARTPVRFSSSLQCFVAKSRVLPGLHSVLRSLFYPHYSYGGVLKQGQVTVNVTNSQSASGKQRRSRVRMPVWVARRAQMHAQGQQASVANPSADERTPYGQQQAMLAGSALDKEMKESIDLAVKYGIRWDVFCDARQSVFDELLNGIQRPERASVMHLSRNLSASARAVWNMLKEYKLFPIASQVLCGDGDDWKLATFADIVCLSQDKQTIFILEIKLNYRHRAISSGHCMLAPFDAWTDCAQNQMTLQAAATAVLYHKHHQPKTYVGAMVVVVDASVDKGYEVHRVAPETMRSVRDVFDELVVLERAEGMKKEARKVVREEAKKKKRAAEQENGSKNAAKRAKK